MLIQLHQHFRVYQPECGEKHLKTIIIQFWFQRLTKFIYIIYITFISTIYTNLLQIYTNHVGFGFGKTLDYAHHEYVHVSDHGHVHDHARDHGHVHDHGYVHDCAHDCGYVHDHDLK